MCNSIKMQFGFGLTLALINNCLYSQVGNCSVKKIMANSGKYKYIVVLLILFNGVLSSTANASANTFLRETERLIALSDQTYTVVVSQYEQTFSYSTGINRFMVRVLDIKSNKLVSEVVLSSTRVDTASQSPFEKSYSLMADETVAIPDVLIQPQTLLDNQSFPKYIFRIDSTGVFIVNEERKNILPFSVVQSRFSEAGSALEKSFDANFNLQQRIDANDVEFTGWYKTRVGEKLHYFFVLKLGRHNDDTGGLEYVFSIPNAED